jgi:protoporphyrinogen IX oxidase
MAYFWVKTFHLLFVMAWIASVFYLPRILVNRAEVGAQPAVQERLQLMGSRLYKFGHTMFGLALILGLVLWMGFKIGGGWMHAKFTIVIVLLAYFIYCGKMLKRSVEQLPSSTALRWINEVPILLVLAIIYLVLAKPF